MIDNALVVCNTFSGPLPPTTNNWLAENFPAGRACSFSKQVPLVPPRVTIETPVWL